MSEEKKTFMDIPGADILRRETSTSTDLVAAEAIPEQAIRAAAKVFSDACEPHLVVGEAEAQAALKAAAPHLTERWEKECQRQDRTIVRLLAERDQSAQEERERILALLADISDKTWGTADIDDAITALQSGSQTANTVATDSEERIGRATRGSDHLEVTGTADQRAYIRDHNRRLDEEAARIAALPFQGPNSIAVCPRCDSRFEGPDRRKDWKWIEVENVAAIRQKERKKWEGLIEAEAKSWEQEAELTPDDQALEALKYKLVAACIRDIIQPTRK